MKKRTILSAAPNLYALAWAIASGLLILPSSVAAQADAKLLPYKGISNAEKISQRLLDSAESAKSTNASLKDQLGAGAFTTTQSGVVLDVVTSDQSPATLKAIAATGATVLDAAPEYNRITLEVANHDQVLALASIDGVSMIRPQIAPVKNSASKNVGGVGSVDGYARFALNADLASSKYGVHGQGVRVGILSDSYASTPAVRTANTGTNAVGTRRTEVFSPGTHSVYFVLQPGANGSATEDRMEVEWFTKLGAVSSSTCPIGVPADIIKISGAAGYISPETNNLLSSTTNALPAPLAAEAPNSKYWKVSFQTTTVTEVVFEAFPLDSEDKILIAVGSGCGNTETSAPTEANVAITTGLRGQLSGDLPSRVTILSDFGQGSDEGNAMGELINDIAPRASQYFHTAFLSPTSFANGIRALAGIQGVANALITPCKVIVDDVVWPGEPWYQVDIISEAVADAVNAGSTYFAAAGNFGDYAFHQAYVDVNNSQDNTATIPNGVDLHRWPTGNGYLPITLPPGGSFSAVMQWNQPSESVSGGQFASQIDFDVFLTLTPNAAGLDEAFSFQGREEGRYSRERQGMTGIPSGDPVEVVSYSNPTGESKTVYLAIDHFHGNKDFIPQIAGVPVEFRVVFFDVTEGVMITGVNTGSVRFPGASTIGQSTAPEAISVAAVNYIDTPFYGTGFFQTNEIDPEEFSSRGGTIKKFFTRSGAVTNVSAFKPDITAVDGNNTTFFPAPGVDDFDLDGHPNFFGTSAAAPNAAAVAALMLTANRGLTPTQVRAGLEGTALDIRGHRAAVGRDNVSGVGLIDAEKALDYVAENFGASTDAPAPAYRFQDFNTGAEGWAFETIPGFDPAGAATPPGQLELVATNNDNTYGSWKSPTFVVSPNLIQNSESTTINGRYGTGSLYRLEATVNSTAADQKDSPNFRFRASSIDFEQTEELLIESVGDGVFSPEAGLPKTYRQYFTLPPQKNRFFVFFDVLGFATDNTNGTRLGLDQVVVYALDESQLLDQKLVRQPLFFRNNVDNGWTARSIPAVYSPMNTSKTTAGLRVGGAVDGTKTSFSWWGSPENNPVFTMEKGRIYRITFRMTSDAPANKRAELPTFRLRVNDTSYRLSTNINVDSKTETSNAPVAGTFVDYKLFFEAPDELVGNGILLSLDGVFVPGTGSDASLAVTLDSLSVHSFARPPQ